MNKRYTIFLRLVAAACFFCWASHTYAQENETTEALPDSANSSTEANTAPSSPAILDYIAQDISSLMFDDEYEMLTLVLNAGSEREREYEFPIFAGESHRPLSTGTVYLVSDLSLNGAHIHNLLSIADSLQDLGWHTVVMPAPPLLMLQAEVDALTAELNTQTEAANTEAIADSDAQSTANANGTLNDEQTDSQTDTQNTNSAQLSPQTMLASKTYQGGFDSVYQQAYMAYLEQFIDAAMKANQAKGYIVWFAQGMSAQALLKSSLQNAQANAIVINNAYWPERDINQALPNLVARSPIPVLDLISAQDNAWSMQTRQARKQQALVQIKTHYRQRELGAFGPSLNLSEKIAKDMEGYFSSLGW